MTETTYKTLGDLKRRKESKENNQESAVWFSGLFKNKKKVKVRFLQELTEDADLFDPNRGTFLGALEHTAPGPQGFMRRALDTLETEGRDWAQEQHDENPGLGWGPKENFYINVAVETFNEEGEKSVVVAILTRSIQSEFVDNLITRFEESQGRGISDQTFWIEKVGSGLQTKWKLSRETDPEKQIDTAGLECFDLDKTAVRRVPYAEQQRFYMSKADLNWAWNDLAKRVAKKKEISFEEALEVVGAPKASRSDDSETRSRPQAKKADEDDGYGW